MNVLDQINTAKHLIAENYKTEITPKDIATKINMSYSCFRKVFKQYIRDFPHPDTKKNYGYRQVRNCMQIPP